MRAPEVHTEGEGPPLALLHGVGTSRVIWRRVTGELARERRVLTVDVPGFGTSDAVGAGFELARVADALTAALERAAGGPFDLVGHSLGGALATALAARHPPAVRELVLVAPAGLEPRPRALAAAVGLAGEGVVRVRRRIGGPLTASPWGRQALFAAVVHDPAALSVEDARSMLDASTGATRVRAGVATAVAADVRPLLAALPAPLGVIWGDRDRVLAPRGVEEIRRLRPDARVVTLPATGHGPQIERPAAFLAALRELLAL